MVPVVVSGTVLVPSTDYDPYYACYAPAFGLPHDEAVCAVTIYAARTLGVEQELGSLAPGKIADVIVTDGDLLEIATHVEYVFIDGVQTSLTNRQTVLRDKYQTRLQRLQAK